MPSSSYHQGALSIYRRQPFFGVDVASSGIRDWVNVSDLSQSGKLYFFIELLWNVQLPRCLCLHWHNAEMALEVMRRLRPSRCSSGSQILFVVSWNWVSLSLGRYLHSRLLSRYFLPRSLSPLKKDVTRRNTRTKNTDGLMITNAREALYTTLVNESNFFFLLQLELYSFSEDSNLLLITRTGRQTKSQTTTVHR